MTIHQNTCLSRPVRSPLQTGGHALAAMACMAFLMSGVASASPTIRSVGALGNTGSSNVTSRSASVSAEGSVVVGYANTDPGVSGFRWTGATGIQALSMRPGAISSYAYAVSADGLVTVGVDSGLSTGFRAVRWSDNGAVTELGVVPNGRYAVSKGVNSDGSVVVGGCVLLSPPNTSHAFRWTAAGGMQDIGVLPGMSASSATSTSADGSTVVGASSSVSLGAARAFRWTSAGGMQDLGVLPGQTASYGQAVSADGTTVVGYCDTVPFLWTESFGMQELGLLPGATYGQANAVSGDGGIVVGFSSGSTSAVGATLWSALTGVVNLNAFLPTLGVDLTGWELHEASGISPDGSALTGWGYYNNSLRGWVVTGLAIPAPTSAAMLCVGGAIAVTRRRFAIE